MAKEIINLRNKLDQFRFCCDLKQKVPCAEADNKAFIEMLKRGEQLPDGVYRYRYETGEEADEFYTVHESDLSRHEVMEYIAFKQLEMLQKIKRGVYFFVWLTVIGMVCAVLATMLGLISLA